MNASARARRLGRQIDRLDQRIAELSATTLRLSQLRLLAFLAIFVVGAPLFFAIGPTVFWPVALLLVILFITLVALHRRRQLSLTRHQLARRRKLTQLARQQIDWANLPPYAGPQPEPEHSFAADIDLVGPRSFHQLVSTARTRGGHNRLYSWLSQTHPSLREARGRQELVQELLPHTILRQRLALAADLVADETGHWDTEALLAWAEAGADTQRYRSWLIASISLASLNLALFIANVAFGAPRIWPAVFLVYLVVTFSQSRLIAEVFTEATALQDAFRQLTAIFATLEKFRYHRATHLADLCQPFQTSGQRPSDYLRRVAGVVSATAIRNNPLLWMMVNAAVPWDFFFAYRLAVVKNEVAVELPDWLDRYYELEAYASLAEYAYLNPGYIWPELVDGAEPRLEAVAIGHPLIPAEQRVPNDLALQGEGAMLLITGSNMAGKSTFLRTIGLNLVVALAGGPVAGQAFRAAPMRLFSSIRVTDSVTDGISYFYAEVRRLRALLDAIDDDQPLFFLIDEIFRGTNNEERRLGSEALIRALSRSSASGLISTHDLGLVGLADEIPTLQNFHFRDEIEGDRMLFDYRLRPGPSPTTNALHIMRTAGLPVPERTGR